jgi:hypothetical protein
MPAPILDRNAERIRKKTELISEDSDALNYQIPEHLSAVNLQSAIRSQLALGFMWRSLVNDITADMMAVNLRELADPLRQKARRTVAGCTQLLSMAQGVPSLVEVRDLELMHHEMENLVEWFETWPDWDSTKRDAARRSIAAGEFVSDEEFLAMA